ncbi:MAG TPA: hypothetical protein VJR92_16205 [Gemmatimonadaceae bacterium]|nr:hypothetical protein [Gemmatimonadaceae bacterium]
MLAFLVSRGEVLFPELHDGDDGVASVQRASPHAPAPANSDHGRVPAHAGAHIDHCGHSHGATVCDSPRVVTTARGPRVAAADAKLLRSVARAPQERPPIF